MKGTYMQKTILRLITASLIILFILTIARLFSGIALLTQIGLTLIAFECIIFSVLDFFRNNHCYITTISGITSGLLILSMTWPFL